MDDRTKPQGPIFFRYYADDTVRPDVPAPVEPAPVEPAPVERDDPARTVNNPWAGELRVTYRKAAPQGETRPSRPTDGPPPQRRLAHVAVIGATFCAAVVAGRFMPWPGDRTPAAPPAARPQVAAAPPLQIELPGSVPAQPPSGLTTNPAPSGDARTKPSEAARREHADAATGEAPVRVFVHVTSAAQLPAANRIRAQLGALRVAGQPVAAPPARIVASSPRRTELRCLKHADCPAADRVARRLAPSLGTPVAVVDMSPRYEGDRRVRPGSLELWLRL